MASILVVDDEHDTAELLKDGLRRRGYDADAVYSAERCIEYLRLNSVDIVLTDVQMPGMSGIELCNYVREHYPDILSLVVTGHGALDLAVAAIRVGAFDFITKPVKLDALVVAMRRALDHLSLKRELQRLRTTTGKRGELDGIVG